MSHNAAVGFRFARRLSRGRGIWLAGAPWLVASASVVATFLLFASLHLTPEQAIERDLGGYSESIGFGFANIAPGSATAEAVERELRDRGLGSATMTLSIVGVKRNGSPILIREANWRENPLPGRYRLRSGRWSEGVGEAVLVNYPGADPDLERQITLLSGRMPLRVVGVADDRYSERQNAILVGKGTWRATPADTTDVFEAVTADAVIFWDGSRNRAMVSALIAGLGMDSSDRIRAEARESEVTTGDVVHATAVEKSESNLYAYQVPSVLLILLMGLLAASLMLRHSAQSRRALRLAGCPSGVVSIACTVSSAAVLIVQLFLGVVVGVGIAYGARPLLLRMQDGPLSPTTFPAEPLGRLGVGLILTLIVILVGSRSGFGRGRPSSGPVMGSSGSVDRRRWIACVLAAVAIVAAPTVEEPIRGMVVASLGTLSVGLLAPDLTTWLCDRFRPKTLQQSLAVRLLTSRPSSAVIATMISVLMGTVFAFLVLLSTLIATVGDGQIPDVLPDQILIADRATPVLPLESAVTEALSHEIESSGAEMIQLHFAADGLEDDPSARVVKLVGGNGYLLAVENLNQARLLLGSAWDDGYSAALARGGAVRWGAGADGSGTAEVLVDGSVVGNLAVVDRKLPRVGWAAGKAGLTLVTSLEEMHLPVMSGGVVLAHAEPELASRLRATLRARGLDEDSVTGFHATPVPVPRPALALTAFVLTSICLVGISAATWSTTTALQQLVDQLQLSGVDIGWVRGVIVRLHLLLLVPALLVGLVAGVVPLVALIPRFGETWVITIPWLQLAALGAAAVLAGLLGALIQRRRLR